MPKTQLEWLARLLLDSNESLADPDCAPVVAEFVLSAWPSSPQGLATKALMDVLRQVRVREIEWSMDTRAQLGPLVDRALDAARKAGL